MAWQSGSDEGIPDWREAERDYEDELRERGTIPELFEASAQRHADQLAQLYKGGISNRSMTAYVPEPPAGEYGSLTYGELQEIVRNLAAGFRNLGLDHGDSVGIFANTRMEWAQADLGVLAAGGVVTTVYTDSSPEQAEYLLDDPGATGVVVEDDDLLETVLAVEDELELSWIVVLDETDHEREDIHTLAEVHETGSDVFDPDQYAAWLDETDPSDLASIIYTSGTTGRPKGVRLTHWNFRSNVHQIRRRVGPRPSQSDRFSVGPGTVSISFLPLAHVLERLAGHFLMLGSGATVGYAESPDTLSDDLTQVRPHTGASVPRVYERIFDRMRTQASSGSLSFLTERIFEWSLDVARQYARTDDPGTVLRAKHALADRLVYSTVKEQMGGRLECMVSGGGSLSEDLARLFKGMGVPILEGYGLTETSPVVSVNTPDDVRPGTLGPPLEGVEVAFDESPSIGTEHIDAEGRVGELLVRGDNVFEGYWNQPGATKRAFVETVPGHEDRDSDTSKERWFRTGDLIEQTPDGFLVFHERLKQLFVLSTGKNVAPGPIEDRFATSDRIEQIMVVGDDRKFIGALVVPNFARLRAWADERGYDLADDREQLVADERVVEWVSEEIGRVNEDLERIEQIKEFALVPEEWTAENDMLTPSMKKKRRNILNSYDGLVAEIYE
ncbi:AMP-dependent synthetase/ligase [Halovenus marina]|uniref:AMP-dependent synthetase/ligase n=1 Tax=Halovenus marina TaxID=3396621 RepID=UPI003F56F38B